MTVLFQPAPIMKGLGMEKTKVLIAEDNEVVHKALTLGLSKEYELLHAFDGEEAFISAVKNKPDVILLDVMMPVMDGRTVCKKLKSDPETSSMKIVMVTGRDDQNDRLIGFEVGADEYLTKPCTFEYIKRAINKVLKKPPS